MDLPKLEHLRGEFSAGEPAGHFFGVVTSNATRGLESERTRDEHEGHSRPSFSLNMNELEASKWRIGDGAGIDQRRRQSHPEFVTGGMSR
jgi:hypothetical protein